VSTFLLSWSEGVTAIPADAGDLVVQGPAGRVSLRRVNPHVIDILRRIEPPGADDQQLAELVQESCHEFLPCWYYYLERLTRRGLLCHSAHEKGARLATLVAISPSFVVQTGGVIATRRYILSRFAYLRRDGDNFVLESPRAHARIVLNDCRTAALVAALSVPAIPAEVARHPHGLSVESVDGILLLLLRARMLEEVPRDGTSGEDQDQALQTWSFHDLLFHARSRTGRSDAPYGATYRLAGKIPPTPALKPPMGLESHDLYRPDLETLKREDPPLAHVQEQRRSIREFDGRQPITAQQLGEFLFRVARTRDYRQVNVMANGNPVEMDFASRPYPSGGGLYEIEFYAAIQQCDGLDPGLYHYAPERHVLERLSECSDETKELLRDAAESTSIPCAELQVLIILAARFPRLAWKYESIAYALILKHVGVIYQTMYLAATAMGLAPCGIGGGDSDLFSRAVGAEYSAESSVGEFLLGSVRPDLADCNRCDPEGEMQ